MSLIKKYNLAEEDLYKICCVEHAKKQVSFFQKEKLKGKILNILSPYNIKFMDLGNLLKEISLLEFHSDNNLIEKYGTYDIDAEKTSMGGKYTIPIFIGSFIFFLIMFYLFF